VEPRRVFYIHVMKTGGTTLLAHIRENLPADEVYPDPDVDIAHDSSRPVMLRHLTLSYLRTIPEERRQRIRVYAGHFPYVARELLGEGLTTLTILRDPVERTISLLRQWCRNRPNLALSFEDAYELPEVFDRLVHNHQTKVFSMTTEDDPTGYMQVVDVDRERLALAKENLASVDIVGLTERYDDFLDLVTARFGWQVRREARMNAAPPDDVLPVSLALRQRIAEDNAIDLELYEHATQLVDERQRSHPRPA
jgi:hypothetical protein